MGPRCETCEGGVHPKLQAWLDDQGEDGLGADEMCHIWPSYAPVEPVDGRQSCQKDWAN